MTKIYQERRSPSSELMGSTFVAFDADKGELTTEFTPPPEFASPRGAAHADLMGVQFESWDAEREEITLRFHAPDVFITPRGSVQGGLIAGFLDKVIGWAYVWATEQQEAPLNLEINMTLLKPVLAGPLIGKGRVVKRGRRVVFLENELFGANGQLLARATSTAIPTPKPVSEG